eukprot:6149468-Prymnesium_polylepis.1
MKRAQPGASDQMDFEAANVQSTLNVDAVAKSLEAAASQVKQLTMVTGAQDVKVSVNALTKQVQTLQGAIANHHSEVVAAINVAAESQRKEESKNSNIMLKAIQAQTHHQYTQNIRKRVNKQRYAPSSNEKACLTFIAGSYGWKIGDKEKKSGYYGHQEVPLESDQERIERRWKDALECLEVVTIPGALTRGGASYSYFVS